MIENILEFLKICRQKSVLNVERRLKNSMNVTEINVISV